MTETITGTTVLRYPSASPSDTNWGLAPKSEWQIQMNREIRTLLYDGGWMRRRATSLYFHGYAVQVYLDNWTLHFQIGIGGNEFKGKRYDDLDGKALVAFDVEGARPGMDRKDLNMLKNEIHAALVEEGVYEKLGVEDNPICEHLVWETVDARDIELGAKRLIEYMDAIYDIALPILEKLQNAPATT